MHFKVPIIFGNTLLYTSKLIQSNPGHTNFSSTFHLPQFLKRGPPTPEALHPDGVHGPSNVLLWKGARYINLGKLPGSCGKTEAPSRDKNVIP